MKTKWSVTDVTPVEFLDRAEHVIWGVILAGHFLPIQALFVAETPLCDVGTPS